MKKIIILCIIPLFFGFKSGEGIDENKMNRDLEIAKNIIATLIKTDANSFFGGNSIEASYIKGYGVVFTIPEHLVFFHGGPGNFFVMPKMPDMEPFEMEFHFESEDGSDSFEQEEQFRVQNKARLEQDKAQMEQEKEKAEHEMEMAREQANIARREAERAQ